MASFSVSTSAGGSGAESEVFLKCYLFDCTSSEECFVDLERDVSSSGPPSKSAVFGVIGGKPLWCTNAGQKFETNSWNKTLIIQSLKNPPQKLFAD